MDVANLPATVDNSSVLSPNDRFEEAIADRVANGERPDAIAASIYPDDRQKRRSLRRRIWYLVRQDERFAHRVAARVKAEWLMALGPATRGLARRASRGDPVAVKLLYEASGLHNPKVDHKHSGEIAIKLSMPRPKAIEGEAIEDAEVVD